MLTHKPRRQGPCEMQQKGKDLSVCYLIMNISIPQKLLFLHKRVQFDKKHKKAYLSFIVEILMLHNHMPNFFLEILRGSIFAHTHLQKRWKYNLLKGIWKVEMLGLEVLNKFLNE